MSRQLVHYHTEHMIQRGLVVREEGGNVPVLRVAFDGSRMP